MASSLLYHVTPTHNLNSILGTGLVPQAGGWRGPAISRISATEMRRAREVVGRAGRRGTATLTGDGFVQFELVLTPAEWRQLARAGIRWDGWPNADEWEPKVFLCTSVMAAYEIARCFRLDGHHQSEPLVLLAIERHGIEGRLLPDTHFYMRSDERGTRLRRLKRACVMTDVAVSPSAIIWHRSVPADLMKLAEFRRWLGQATYEKSKWKWRLRH